MRRKYLVVVLLPLVSGCGGVADNLGVNMVSVGVKNGAIPVVGEPVEIAWDNRREKTATDSTGQAKAEFHYMWNSYFFVIPPIGSIPQHSQRPEYSIFVAGTTITIPKDSGATAYDSEASQWKTKLQIDLKELKKPEGGLITLAPITQTFYWKSFILTPSSLVSPDGRYRLKKVDENGWVELTFFPNPSESQVVVAKPAALKFEKGAGLPSVVVVESNSKTQTATLNELLMK